MPRTPSERKTTSKRVGRKAAKALRDRKASKREKSIAGSALSQSRGRKGK